MSEPLYQIGQQVAAMTSDLKTVIPVAVVVGVQWDEAGWFENPTTGEVIFFEAHWAYWIDATHDRWAERCLRPIGPNEYTDTTTEELERTA